MANTPRQLSDASGGITLSARYTPCPFAALRMLREGDTLETYGTGNFTFGYFGGVMDAATGLIYVGNGQYYDPETGRFLTRDVYPNSTNPYVPWNPIGAIVGPLGLIALVFGRRKKGSKAGTFLVLVLVVGSVGMMLVACGPTPPSTPQPQPTSTPDNSVPTIPPGTPEVGGSGTDSGGAPGGAIPPIETPTIPCLTPLENIPAPIFTPTPSPYIDPWKRYKDYDPVTNSIPRDKWGGLDSNTWDKDRSKLVWEWLGETIGPDKWWSGKYPNAEELTAWLLWQEGAELFSQNPVDNVYEEGGGRGAAKLMIRFMHGLFGNGIDEYDLARFTAFFNPDGYKPFDENDWAELTTPPAYYPYVNTVNDFWGLGPLYKELTWWEPGEPGFNYTPEITVWHPDGSGVIMYLAYK